MMKATIFFNDDALLKNERRIFDVRFDGQIIPCGCVVAGYMADQNGQIAEVLDPPAMTDEQEMCWHKVVEYARNVLLYDAHDNIDEFTWSRDQVD